MTCYIPLLVFVHVMLFIELVHAFRVVKDQDDECIDRSLLREPESEFVAADLYGIERFNQDDSEQVRNDKPDHETNRHEPKVCAPIAAFIRHRIPLVMRVLFSLMRR
jgi:hypothetical protein